MILPNNSHYLHFDALLLLLLSTSVFRYSTMTVLFHDSLDDVFCQTLKTQSFIPYDTHNKRWFTNG